MTADGKHSEIPLPDQYPGSDLSISELSYALKTKFAQGGDSRYEYNAVALIAGNSFERRF